MFQWFRDRKAKQAISVSSAAMVRMQFVISDVDPSKQTGDNWVLGYVFGAVTGLLQLCGIEPDGRQRPFLLYGYESVYGEFGHLVLEKSLTKTRERDFAEAQLVGASEMLAARPDGPVPFGLGAYLGSAKGLGSDSVMDVRIRLRERAMERMTKEGFEAALERMVAGG